MQFNRKEYLNENYDFNSSIERENSVKALNKCGLDWNLYIKDYVLRELRKELMNMDGTQASALLQFVPMLQLGMFNTIVVLLMNTTFETEQLEQFRIKWIELLKSANDIEDEIYGL